MSLPTTEANLEQRFLEKTTKGVQDDCWLWVGARSSCGYGNMMINGTVIRAHRVAYKLYKGNFPKHLLVLHKCDNHSCVNPNHLFLGTHKDNAMDMVAKGRQGDFKGVKNPSAKLTVEQVQEIRKLGTTCATCKAKEQLGMLFGVSRRTIGSILNNEIYKEL